PAFDEVKRFRPVPKPAFELGVLYYRENFLEDRSWRKTSTYQVIARNERFRIDVFIGPSRKSAQNVVDVTQILSGRHKVNPCKLQVIFKPIEPEKTFHFRDRHLPDSEELGQVPNQGKNMMHLGPRTLQALHDGRRAGDNCVVK